MSLNMNARQGCPSRGCLITSRAHGRICPVCEPDEVYPVRCPVCFDAVDARGGVMVEHAPEGVDGYACPGGGQDTAGRWAA